MKQNVLILFSLFITTASFSQATPSPAEPSVHVVLTTDSTLKKSGDTVYVVTEVMPEFPGGREAFALYLQNSVRYPQEEKMKGMQGTVYVSFIVEKDGSVTNVHAVKEVAGAPGLTEEAERVIREMPKWSPALLNGKPVRMTVTQPIKFVLQSGKKKKR